MSLFEHGFVVLNNVVSANECDRLAARIDSIGRSAAGSRCLLDRPSGP